MSISMLTICLAQGNMTASTVIVYHLQLVCLAYWVIQGIYKFTKSLSHLHMFMQASAANFAHENSCDEFSHTSYVYIEYPGMKTRLT